jgi:hypothetical protein
MSSLKFTSLASDIVYLFFSNFQNHGILAIPTVPGPPPKLMMDAGELENFRARAFSLLSIAGMTGFCQVSGSTFFIDSCCSFRCRKLSITNLLKIILLFSAVV